ncbi:gp22.1 [Bacillus phage SPO1]|uniref:dUTP diphosphatase n=3 Tax=Okubovirus TaxID=1857845 RepID=B6V2T0_BPSP1|nr:gp22.1 [Bacillus phage SPO1]YP_008770053.1 dUTP pyrophosphatase [Bacillus phage CampHawk]APZ82354.1 dUTP pyrophosphatase [Bacillus phage vB_BsuM-Goe2]UNY49069.1 deoxyuridine 5'-triphosphate nucleotidohydrolase [Bacillus phage SP82G]WCS68758.1 deoxyuridine 5'-triphosphate nucleotidohydrolase [Bacillus phage vB_BsuM-Goe19]ACI91022.1 gp22.1 [Bacillus phage SPO1]AGY46997.1 dUTP pyrophosphatase [Bacillus phage CampHawk]
MESNKPMRYYSNDPKHDLSYGSEGAAGIDLPYYDDKKHANLDNLKGIKKWFAERKFIFPFKRYKLPTGIHVEMDKGEYGEIDTRSSTSKKLWLPLCRTIDEDFRGNIHVVFMSFYPFPRIIKARECRFQMVVKPYNKKSFAKVSSKEQLSNTNRGENGFGSTDNKGDKQIG